MLATCQEILWSQACSHGLTRINHLIIIRGSQRGHRAIGAHFDQWVRFSVGDVHMRRDETLAHHIPNIWVWRCTYGTSQLCILYVYVVCVYVLHVYVCMEICLCLCVSASMGKPRNIRLKLVKCPSQEVTITQPLFCLSFLAIYAFSSLPFLSVRREEAHTPVKILAEPSTSKPPVSRPNRLSADPTVNSEIISGIHWTGAIAS